MEKIYRVPTSSMIVPLPPCVRMLPLQFVYQSGTFFRRFHGSILSKDGGNTSLDEQHLATATREDPSILGLVFPFSGNSHH